MLNCLNNFFQENAMLLVVACETINALLFLLSLLTMKYKLPLKILDTWLPLTKKISPCKGALAHNIADLNDSLNVCFRVKRVTFFYETDCNKLRYRLLSKKKKERK